MIVFFDTSVLIAATDEDHQDHLRAYRRLDGAGASHLFCAAHSLAEYYAVVTRLPGRSPVKPAECLGVIERLLERLTAIALTPAEYLATIHRLSEAGLSGGIVYDALLLACARKCKAEAIYTLNERHFTRLAPDLSDRIRTP
jgi:predicted nucleic acid-binding protein